MDGDVLAKMTKVEAALTKLANATTENVDKIQKKLGEMSDGLRKVGETMAAAFAVDRIIEFGKEILHTTAEFEGFQNVIKYSSLNAYDAGENLAYVESAVKRLHLPLREAMEGFSEMQAGLIGTGIEGDRLRKLFEGISTASSVLHLSAYNLQRTLYDFKEIGEIGLNARIMRSLQTALPGVGQIIKETFHKSFQELEKEHFNGGQFLAGLSEGLQKHFASGLANAGNSLIAKMNDMSTAWTKFKLSLGENLRPVFIDIMDGLGAIFNSVPVQFFIQNIATLVTTVGKLIPMWAIYKTLMFGIEGVTRLAAKAQMLYAAAMGESTVMINGATVAVEGFEGAFMATGIGVFAVGLGLVIEKLISMNSEMDESVEKVTHLKAATDAFNSLDDQFNRIKFAYQQGVDKMDPKSKNEMFSEMSTVMDKLNNEIKDKTLSLGMSREKVGTGEPKQLQGESDVAFSGRLERYWTEQNKLKDAIISLQEKIANATTEKGQLEFWQRMLGAIGGKPDKPTPFAENNAFKDSSLHTSELAGAKGGLGEAKTITIHFHDALQKIQVTDGRGIKAAGQSAIEIILRTLNNLAYGQSRTM